MTDAPVVSIIIVTYGTGPVVLEALDAVARSTPIAHEVIVVDGLPPDPQSRTSRLLGDRTDIRLIEANDNLGFAGSNELGVEQAHGELLCFLNPDVIVGPGWLEPLVGALDDPVVGIAAPVFLNDDGSLQEAGQLIFADTFTSPVGGPDVMPGDDVNVFSRDIDYASAACWLVRRSEHVARGGFDRRYHPAYFEDADYALRVEAGGQRSRLVADVPVVHRRGQGTGHREATVGQATHARFCSMWAERLAEQPQRPSTDATVIVGRDRLVDRRIVVVAWSDRTTEAEFSAAFDRAVLRAADMPRSRVTLLTDVRVTAEQRANARAAGLELVVAPPDRESAEAARSATADEIVRIGSGRHRARSRALAVAVAAVVFVVGVVLRWWLFDSPAAVINADEAYTRIETYEILRGQFPMVLGGTVYTLPIEAYLYTPFTYLFNGANVVPLKLLSTASWLLMSVTLYAIGTRLVNRRVGVIAAAMCWITPGALLVLSITAYPAYASGMLVTALAFLTAITIVDTRHPARRSLVLFGILAGFGFWLHPMFLATLVPMVLFVLWTFRRRLDAWVGVIGGGILGCLPLLLWNAVNSWPSLETPVRVAGTYTDRLRTFAIDLLPRAFGLRDSSLEWYDDALGPALYALLLTLVAIGVWRIATGFRQRSHVLVLVVLAAVFPIMALFRNLIYANDGRYAMISLPFVLVALATAVDHLAGRRPPLRVAAVLALVGAVWIAGFVRPNTQPFLDARGVDPNAQLTEVVDVLDEAGIDRIYGSYWAVLPIDFAGDNRIVSAVFPFWPVRFPDRQREVGQTPNDEVAVIFTTDDEDPAYLLLAPDQYERIVIGGRVLYLPLAASSSD